MAKSSGSTKSVGASGASATRTIATGNSASLSSLTMALREQASAVERMSAEERFANASIKLSSSDMKWIERLDNEANEDLGRNDMKRWDIPNIPYKDMGKVKTSYATITQFLDKPGGKVSGYEIYFDKASPVGEAKTLSEAKEKLLKYINSKRG